MKTKTKTIQIVTPTVVGMNAETRALVAANAKIAALEEKIETLISAQRAALLRLSKLRGKHAADIKRLEREKGALISSFEEQSLTQPKHPPVSVFSAQPAEGTGSVHLIDRLVFHLTYKGETKISEQMDIRSILRLASIRPAGTVYEIECLRTTVPIQGSQSLLDLVTRVFPASQDGVAEMFVDLRALRPREIRHSTAGSSIVISIRENIGILRMKDLVELYAEEYETTRRLRQQAANRRHISDDVVNFARRGPV